ncbi:MAG: hypothetical protein LBI27_04600 [Clostridiales bacterium]|jgi:hypothetical protein|nr:hypothetical protein [Clostridiales bacterium]
MRNFFLAFIIILLSAANVFAAFDVQTATLTGQLDYAITGVADFADVSEREEASAAFSIGNAAIIYLEFDGFYNFVSNDVSIVTTIPVNGNADAASANAEIISFAVNGNDLGAQEIASTKRNDEGFLVLDLSEYNLVEIHPLETFEIIFAVRNMPSGIEDAPLEPFEPISAEIADEIEVQEPTLQQQENQDEKLIPIPIVLLCLLGVAIAIGILALMTRKRE